MSREEFLDYRKDVIEALQTAIHAWILTELYREMDCELKRRLAGNPFEGYLSCRVKVFDDTVCVNHQKLPHFFPHEMLRNEIKNYLENLSFTVEALENPFILDVSLKL